MIVMQGKGVSKGVANGSIYFFQRSDTAITDTPAADIEAEKARIAEAQEKSMDQLNALADKARAETGEETAILFETHAMFVEDEDYVECMMNALEERGCTAEKAVEIAGEEFSAMLAAMDDPYMQGRAADVKDVTRRILNNLMGIAEGGIDSDVPVILAADNLAPSETLQLDKSKILGFVTQSCSSVLPLRAEIRKSIAKTCTLKLLECRGRADLGPSTSQVECPIIVPNSFGGLDA